MISLNKASNFAILSEVTFAQKVFVQNQIDSKDLNL